MRRYRKAQNFPFRHSHPSTINRLLAAGWFRRGWFLLCYSLAGIVEQQVQPTTGLPAWILQAQGLSQLLPQRLIFLQAVSLMPKVDPRIHDKDAKGVQDVPPGSGVETVRGWSSITIMIAVVIRRALEGKSLSELAWTYRVAQVSSLPMIFPIVARNRWMSLENDGATPPTAEQLRMKGMRWNHHLKGEHLNLASRGKGMPLQKWSNPDPYTVLPPIDESQRKRKDVSSSHFWQWPISSSSTVATPALISKLVWSLLLWSLRLRSDRYWFSERPCPFSRIAYCRERVDLYWSLSREYWEAMSLLRNVNSFLWSRLGSLSDAEKIMSLEEEKISSKKKREIRNREEKVSMIDSYSVGNDFCFRPSDVFIRKPRSRGGNADSAIFLNLKTFCIHLSLTSCKALKIVVHEQKPLGLRRSPPRFLIARKWA